MDISLASIWDVKILKISYSHLCMSLLNSKSNMVYNLHRIPLTHVNCINKKKEQGDKLLVTEARLDRDDFYKPPVSNDVLFLQRIMSPCY